MRPFIAIFLFLIAIYGFAAAPRVSAQALDSTLTKRFQLADSYFRAGQFDRAIVLLEDLYHQSPNTFAFAQKLKDAYENLKRYDDAVSIVDAQLQRNENPVYLAEKARLLYLKGDEDAALEAWDSAIELRPGDRVTYRTVYQSMYDVRLISEAIRVLERGRDTLGPDANLHADLAALYAASGDLEQAMQEYVLLLRREPEQLPLVRTRLARVSDDPGQLRTALSVLERAIRQDPLVEPLRELAAWMYVEVGNYMKALDAFRALDRLGDQDGRALYAFAQQAAGAGAFDAGAAAFTELLTRYPSAPVYAEALYGLASMHQQWAEYLQQHSLNDGDDDSASTHFDAALETYHDFLRRYPRHAFYPNALYQVAQIEDKVLLDLDAAEATLKQLISASPGHPVSREAEFELGIIALRRDRLAQARTIFQRVEEELVTGELAERARFELARTYLYAGDVETALTITSAVNRNTSMDVANDAIDLHVLLSENKGPDSSNTALRTFGRLLLANRQHRVAEALALADSMLARFGNHPIADDVRYVQAGMLRELGDSEGAWTAFAQLPLLHPQSPLVDRSLFQAAQILERDLANASEAIKYYTRLITDYPGSVYAADARTRIRLLRGDGA